MVASMLASRITYSVHCIHAFTSGFSGLMCMPTGSGAKCVYILMGTCTNISFVCDDRFTYRARPIVGPLTLKFDRATPPFLKIDRRYGTVLKLTGIFFFKKRQGTLPFLKIDSRH